jgi:hypothetical protein
MQISTSLLRGHLCILLTDRLNLIVRVGQDLLLGEGQRAPLFFRKGLRLIP